MHTLILGDVDSVLIGADVRVQVAQVRQSQVRFGIAAPKCVAILRKELLSAPERSGETSRSSAGQARK